MPPRVRLWRSIFGLGPIDALLKQRARRLLELSGWTGRLKPGGRYIDIGCGAGHVVDRILRAAPGDVRYLAIDPVWKPAAPVLRRKRARYAERLLFARGDGRNLPAPDGGFDGASIVFVLHHVPFDWQERILAEARRVLKPGALLLLVEDTPENQAEWDATVKADRRFNFESKEEEHFYRSRADWRALVGRLGFELVDEVGFEQDRLARPIPPTPDAPRRGLVHHASFLLRKVAT